MNDIRVLFKTCELISKIAVCKKETYSVIFITFAIIAQNLISVHVGLAVVFDLLAGSLSHRS